MTSFEKIRLNEVTPEPYESKPGANIAGNPLKAATVVARSDDGTTVAGLFRSTKGTFKADMAYEEWTMVRRGRVIVTDGGGRSIDCGPGDVMLLEKGMQYTFEVLEDLEDYFVIINPDGADL